MGCIKCKRALPDQAIYCPFCGKKQVAARRRARRASGRGTIKHRSDVKARPWVAIAPAVLDLERGVYDRATIGSYATRAEAENALQSYLMTPTVRLRDTFADVYASWSAAKFPELSKSMQDCYRAAYAKAAPLHDRKFRDLRKSDLQAVINRYAHPAEGKPLSPSGLHQIKVLFSSLYAEAMQDDIVSKDYSKYVTIPRGDVEEKEAFTAEELRKIALGAEMEIPYADYVLIMCLTGYRVGEFLGLTEENYSPVQRAFYGGGNKTAAGKNRVVPIHDLILPYVQRAAARDGETIFCDIATGEQISTDRFRRTIFPRVLEAVGVRQLTPHATRRTFATRASAAGMLPQDITRIMGHTDFRIDEEHYIKQQADDLLRSVSLIDLSA